MRGRWRLFVAAAWLALLYLVAGLAGFFAPYDPTTQDRSFPFAPPTSIHLVDAEGHVCRPFVYGVSPEAGAFGQYKEDRTTKFPVRLAFSGTTHEFAGLVSSDRHLFGVDQPGRICLMGTDGYGRDQFS